MARKKSEMQAQLESEENQNQEQLDLIDVAPENVKEIISHAKAYKKFQARRIEALEEEVAEKKIILELIAAANISRLDNGVIRFKCDGITITVTPRDELLKIKDDDTDKE